jgi:hypothetical protein
MLIINKQNKTKIVILVFFVLAFYNICNAIEFPEHLKNTQIAKLKKGDSITYYQCHVDSAILETTTSNGHKIKTKKRLITITEKYIITFKDSVYTCKYFQSSVTNYPNKKFPYLTLTEVKNWEFEQQKKINLSENQIKIIAAFETKTHAITHYELNINKSCPNELIIKTNKFCEQFIIEGSYKLIKEIERVN